jgi:hypothetical protein
MSYPQPNPDLAVVKGERFFRLNTPLVSGGDIYESSQGSLAFALGPESDITRVRVTYFDPQADNNIAQIIIGNRPFVGLLTPSLKQQYLPANRPGRILIAPDDLWNPDLVAPNVIDQTKVNTVVIPPQLDIIQYFDDPGALSSTRDDKTYRFTELPFKDNGATAGDAYLMIPFYGRKFMSYSFLNNNVFTPISVDVYGINIGYAAQTLDSAVPLVTNAHQFTKTIAGVYNVAETPADINHGNGMFDYLMFRLTPGDGSNPTAIGPTVQIVVSDEAVAS